MTGSDFDFENMKRKQNDVFGEDEQWAVEGLPREGGAGRGGGAKRGERGGRARDKRAGGAAWAVL